MADPEGGLLHAFRLDGRGGGAELSLEEAQEVRPGATTWVHLDARSAAAERWLRERSGLDEDACDHLLAAQTRPGVLVVAGGLLVILRGVNLNPGADPEDMVSLRLWLEPERVISLRRQRLLSVADVADDLRKGEGPRGAPELLVWVVERLLARMEPVLEELEESLDAQEEASLESVTEELQQGIAATRRMAISLRRHLAPQREALQRLAEAKHPIVLEEEVALRRLAGRMGHVVDALDELRERSMVTHDLLTTRQSEMLNQRMFLLSLITAIFMPLSLLAGLLGINVGGIPGATSPWGFAGVVAVMTALGLVQLWLLRRMGWF